MSTERELLFEDLERAARTRSPELPELLVRFLAQDDPPAGVPETSTEDDPQPAPGAFGLDELLRATSTNALRGKTATERKTARQEAWAAALASPHAVPRLKIAGLLTSLYEAPDPPARALLLEVLARVPLVYGPWQAIKAIYKQAERRHDAAVFAAIATRVDPRPARHGEIGMGTLVYLGRRAWRYLRVLGRAMPEVYVAFAVEVLRRFPADVDLRRSWIANHVWAHRRLIGRGAPAYLTWRGHIEDRYLDAAWKVSAEPLVDLLETCANDAVAELALGYLEKDFAEVLRAPRPEWLVRLAERRLPAIESFVVRALRETPELHASRFRELGLHGPVLRMMTSGNATARAFALEYARAHAGDVPVETLVEWARVPDREVQKYALSRLSALDARAIGVLALAHLAAADEAVAIVKAKLGEGFPLEALRGEALVVLATGTRGQRQLLRELFAQQLPPVGELTALLADARCDYGARQWALGALGRHPPAALDFAWIKAALLDARWEGTVAGWLRSGRFQHPTLDVEWVKGLVFRPKLRGLALELLAHPDWVPPEALGAGWLIALLDHADPALSTFAEERLLSAFSPAALGGIDGVLALILRAATRGGRSGEGARRFGLRFLAAHHPELAGESARGLAPLLSRGDFTLERVRPLLFHEAEAVRALGARIGAHELIGWGDARLPYVLAESPFREARTLARDTLSAVGERGGAPEAWLDREQVFALAESHHKATRELGAALIRRHYDRLEARERLAWLMESPDREVRLFAVRLLWERHRPHARPEGFRPKVAPGVAQPEPHAGSLADRSAELTAFLRSSLFGLPPGRMERRDAKGPKPASASVAKQRLIEVVRDMAIEDRAFGEAVTPILRDFARSKAKGEWQACVAALARIGRVHPDLGLRS